MEVILQFCYLEKNLSDFEINKVHCYIKFNQSTVDNQGKCPENQIIDPSSFWAGLTIDPNL